MLHDWDSSTRFSGGRQRHGGFGLRRTGRCPAGLGAPPQPGTTAPQRQRDAGPHQHDRAGGRDARNRLAGQAQHLTGVREAHHAAQLPARGLRREGVVAHDRSRAIERQRRAQLRLAAVAAIDGERHRRARRLGNAHVDRAPLGLLLRRARQQPVQAGKAGLRLRASPARLALRPSPRAAPPPPRPSPRPCSPGPPPRRAGGGSSPIAR